jgi:hypothetical protein
LSAAHRMLGSRVRISPTAWMSVSCESFICAVRYRSLRGADPSSRGVLPTEVCLTECFEECLNLRKSRPKIAVEQWEKKQTRSYKDTQAVN